MADISSVDKYFITASEEFSDNLSGTVTAGVTTTIGVNDAGEYSDGDQVAWVIAPGTNTQRVVTGTISGDTIINAKWTEDVNGYSGSYSAGTVVADYWTATHQASLVEGLLTEHDQDGTHGNITATSVTTSGAATIGTDLAVGDDLTVTGDTNLNGIIQENGVDSGTIRTALGGFDFVESGLNPSSASGLTVTIPAGVYWIDGKRYTYAGGTKAITASKDAYLDINAAGTITSVEVANGATSGMTLTTDAVRFAKVVSGGASISSYTTAGLDPIGNPIRNTRSALKYIDFTTPTQGGAFTTTSATYVDVTGVTFEYHTGDLAEKLFLEWSAVMSNTSATFAHFTLSVGGTDLSPTAMHAATGTSVQATRNAWVDVAANTQVTIKGRVKTAAGTATVSTNSADFVPTIKGFGVPKR